MVDEAEQLRSVVKWRAAHRANNTASLGEVLSELMENRVSPQQIRFGLIAEAWSQLLPAELYQHCRIVDISSGRLKVLADSPSYMYELQLLSCELLKELSRRHPRARIKEIKFAAG
jgi:predicted nucleic acid-binding Zn ribbon protein